jgi:hypothetical protein
MEVFVTRVFDLSINIDTIVTIFSHIPNIDILWKVTDYWVYHKRHLVNSKDLLLSSNIFYRLDLYVTIYHKTISIELI